MRDHMRTELALSALMMAVQRRRPPRGLIHHSDRGSQFASQAYVDQLAAVGAVPSMSRTGNCYDNAPMKSFFHTLKVELVHQGRWAIRCMGKGRKARATPLRRDSANCWGPGSAAIWTRPGRCSRRCEANG